MRSEGAPKISHTIQLGFSRNMPGQFSHGWQMTESEGDVMSLSSIQQSRETPRQRQREDDSLTSKSTHNDKDKHRLTLSPGTSS